MVVGRPLFCALDSVSHSLIFSTEKQGAVVDLEILNNANIEWLKVRCGISRKKFDFEVAKFQLLLNFSCLDGEPKDHYRTTGY